MNVHRQLRHGFATHVVAIVYILVTQADLEYTGHDNPGEAVAHKTGGRVSCYFPAIIFMTDTTSLMSVLPSPFTSPLLLAGESVTDFTYNDLNSSFTLDWCLSMIEQLFTGPFTVRPELTAPSAIGAECVSPSAVTQLQQYKSVGTGFANSAL